MSGTLIVSPHLDDALLSAGQVAMSTPSTVVTVFAGPPPAEVRLTEWDRLTGASSSHERHRERIVEDQRANALAGSTPMHLSYPEAQFRTGPPDIAGCAAELRALLADAVRVWLPSGIGAHPDHVLARKLALAALPDSPRRPVVGFYGDFPYVVSYGWPTWVSGRPAEQYLDSGAWLDQEFRAAGLPEKGLTPEVVVLTEAERLRKGETIAEYRSQLPGLRLDPTRIGIQQNLLHYEVRWSVDPAALELLVQECRAELDL